MFQFIKNISEDVESCLISMLNTEQLSQIQTQESKLKRLKANWEHTTKDFVWLVQQGYAYDHKKREFSKVEDIDWGRYPGKYKFRVSIPPDYPRKAPAIFAKPLPVTRGGPRYISEHILSGGHLCIARREHGYPDTYWNKDINIKGALQLGYMVVTDEYRKTKFDAKKRIPLKGTIMQRVSEVVDKQDFVEQFCKPNGIPANNRQSWEELAWLISQQPSEIRTKLVGYYNDTKKNSGKRKRTTQKRSAR